MRFRDFHPNVRIRVILNFATNTFINMIMPFMSIYFADRIGPAIAGTNVMLSIVAGIFFSMLGGYYADRFGRRKLMILAESILLLSFVCIMAVNSPWLQSAWITFFLTIICGIAWGLLHPVNDAMLLDVTEPESRKYMYQIMYWINNLSLAIAGIIGAFLFKDYLFELLVAVVVVNSAALIVTILFIKETFTAQASNGEGRGSRGSVWGEMRSIATNYTQVLKDHIFVIYMISSLLIVSVEFHLSNYIGVRLEQEMSKATLFSWGNIDWRLDGIEMLGILRTENTVLVVLFSFFMGMALRKFSEKKMMIGGVIIYVVGYSIIAYSNSPLVLVLAMLFATMGELMNAPVKQAYLGYIIPDHARSSYLAIYGLTYQFAMLIAGAAVTLGAIAPSWLMATLIGTTGAIGILLLLIIMPSLDRKRRSLMASQAQQTLSS